MLDNSRLEAILEGYKKSFASKIFGEESSEEDDLMLVFGLSQTTKAGNRQYWGRELGMCWQKLVATLCQQTCPSFAGPLREGGDEICDFRVNKDAVDTKYRIGSGDSGTLKKFKQYGARLRTLGHRPIVLILRNDNLPAAITACVTGGWTVLAGQKSYNYIGTASGIDLKNWLQARKGKFRLLEQTPSE